MIIDDKKRVIGKIIAINSDRFLVEMLNGIKNFNINGYDDIHYFAQINSYVMVPFQDYYIVSEVVNVREKDNIVFSNNQKEQELNKVYSTKTLEVLPIGTIKKVNSKNKFFFGVSVYPTLYSDVLYIKDNELDCIFEVKDYEVLKCIDCDKGICITHSNRYANKKRLTALEVGKSAIFQDYNIKIKIDDFFGGHTAVLGNTGSGKSCTISSMIQTLFNTREGNSLSAIGSTFVFFDVNGEYSQAFDKLNDNNNLISYKYKVLEEESTDNSFYLPHYFLNVEEWELLLNASEKAQLPILRNALGLAVLFSNNNPTNQLEIKNHILASCILETFNSGDSPVSKYQKIQSLFNRGNFEGYHNIIGYSQQYGNFSNSRNEEVFLETMRNSILNESFEIPHYHDGDYFEFNFLEEALDIAILYEEAHGNRKIRTFCSSLITRFKTLQNRSDFNFITSTEQITKEEYLKDLLSINNSRKEKQITLIDLNSAEDEIVEISSAVITRLIFETLRKARNRNEFPINLVLEEAHRYIAYESKRTFLRANQIFDRVAKEGRKYGLFLLISSQRPSELSKTVLSQCNNFIVHRIQNPEDLSHIKQITPHISETTLKKLPSIPTQHALIFGNAVNIPTLYKVKEANPLPNSSNNKISDNWFIDNNEEIEFLS